MLMMLLVAACISCGGKQRDFGGLGGAGGSASASPGGEGPDDGGAGASGGDGGGGAGAIGSADDGGQVGVAGAAGSSGGCIDGTGSECAANLECIEGTCQCTLTSCPNGCCSAAGVCGSCTPTTLTTRPVAIQALTISSPLLYLLEGGAEDDPEVYSLSTAGGDAQLISVPPPGDDSLSTIVADESFIYGASFNYDQVGRMPTTGGRFTMISGGKTYLARRLLTNTTSVFGGGSLSSSFINVFPKAGGATTTLVDSLTIDYIHFAVDDSFLYFISSGYVLNRIAVTGGGTSRALMASDAGEKLVDVVVAADQAIFASSTRVGKVASTGGNASTLDVGAAYALATDSANAFYFRAKGGDTCAGGSELFSVPLAGGAPRRLAIESSKSCVRSVAEDGSGVYWIADQRIQKIAK